MGMLGYLMVGALGALVGVSELVSRYKDAPERALLFSPSAWFYCLINAAASVTAFRLLVVFGIDFGKSGAALEWTRIMTAGFGAMAFFRTSILTVRVGTQDIGVGPVGFLQVILGAIDRAVDRRRASGRATEVNSLMQGLSFDKSLIALPTYCLALMQNLSDDDQKRLGQSLLTLKQAEASDGVKLRILGVYLLNAVGPVALASAITSLGDEIKEPSASARKP
jgi:hypothetical protein